MVIRAFLFDIGNVLVRFDFSRATKALSARGSQPPEQVAKIIQALIPVLETGHLTTADFLHRVIEETGFVGTQDEAREAYCDIFFPHEPTWLLVERLAQHYPLYLFSNTSELHHRFLFDHYPVFSRFRDGVFSWLAGCMKPDAAFYQKGIDLIGESPESIFYLDDAAANIEAGRVAGLQTHQYDPAQHDKLETALRSAGVEV